MNIDELRSAQSKERQKSDLQQLRESFYGDVAAYVEELEAERERAAERADDPFGSPEVQQLTNDIETAKDTAEAIYERRLGKIVKKASLVSAEMATANDVNGLTAEEQALFSDLVARIEENKTHMLDVIAGDATPGAREDAAESADAPSADASPASADTASADSDVPHPEDGLDDATDAAGSDATETTDAAGSDTTETTDAAGSDTTETTDAAGSDDDLLRSEARAVAGQDDPGPPEDDAPDPDGAAHVSAADLMGGDDDAVDTATDRDAPGGTNANERTDASEGASGTSAPTDAGEGAGRPNAPTDADDGASRPSASTDANERATLRVTEDVGEIFGVDEREYTLSSEDVVTLPEENATALVAQGAAERLE
jgi:DNA replication factor GINS